MKIFKRIMVAALTGAMALSVLTGCSQTASAYTMQGTASMKVNGEQVVTDAPLTMVSDGASAYTKYEIDGSTVEALVIGSDYYQRVYTNGTADAKWTKTTLAATEASADASVKTGTMVIDGVEYQTQTYDEATYYCFDGNTLKYAYTKNGNEEVTVKIDSISTKVDTSVLKAPADSEIEAAA